MQVSNFNASNVNFNASCMEIYIKSYIKLKFTREQFFPNPGNGIIMFFLFGSISQPSFGP